MKPDRDPLLGERRGDGAPRSPVGPRDQGRAARKIQFHDVLPFATVMLAQR